MSNSDFDLDLSTPAAGAASARRILTRLAILEAPDLPVEEVEVPEWWGGVVLVRGLTGAGRDAYEVEMSNLKKKDEGSGRENFRARLVVRCVVDEDGKRVFSNADAERLGQRSATAVDRVFKVAARLSGLTKESAEAAEKNSSSDQSADSGSDSR